MEIWNRPPAIDRRCFRDPISEIAETARLLDAAVTAHLIGRRDVAEELIRLADMPVLRDYTESLWGAKSPHVQYRAVAGVPAHSINDRLSKKGCLRQPSRRRSYSATVTIANSAVSR